MVLTDAEDEEDPSLEAELLDEDVDELELDEEELEPSDELEELPSEDELLEVELDEEPSEELELDPGQPGTIQHPSTYTGIFNDSLGQIRGSGIGGTWEQEEDDELSEEELSDEELSDEEVSDELELELEDEELTLELEEDDELDDVEVELELEDTELELDVEELLEDVELEELDELEPPPMTESQLVRVFVPPPGVQVSGPFPASIQSFPSKVIMISAPLFPQMVSLPPIP